MRNQKGTTLIELMLTVSLMGFVAVSLFAKTNNETEFVLAKKLGAQINEYNTAVQSYIADNPNGTYPLARTGSAWLKHTSCPGGLSSKAYLPCDFPDFDAHDSERFGHLLFTTNLTKTPMGSGNHIQAETITSSVHRQAIRRPDLAGIAAIIAASGNVSIHKPEPMVTTSSYGSDPITAAIIMNASNAPSQDAWLRTNGSNNMRADIAFETTNPANQRQIVGVSSIKGHGSESIMIKTGSSSNSAIEIEPNKISSKAGSNLFEITPTSAITTAGTASVDTRSGSIVSKVGSSVSEITSSRVRDAVGTNAVSEVTSSTITNRVGSTSLEVGQNYTKLTGDHQVTGMVAIGADSDVDFAAIKNSGTDYLSRLRLHMNALILMDGDIVIKNPGSNSANGHLWTDGTVSAETLRVWRMWDTRSASHVDNNYWLLDPDDTTRLYVAWLEGDTIINEVGTPGGACSLNGTLAKSSAGDLLWCASGRWKKAATI